MTSPTSVIDFWQNAGPQRWFAKDEAFDASFRDTFHSAHLQAARRELESWLDSAEGALALLILLDQYPRNAFRGTAHMFATDPLARLYAGRMVDAGWDQLIEPALRAFCYLPFEHSEDPVDQQRSLAGVLQKSMTDCGVVMVDAYESGLADISRTERPTMSPLWELACLR